MNIHIATQGTSTPPIVEGLKHYSVDKLILLYNKGSYSTAKEVKKLTSILDIDCELEEIDMFDQVSVISKIISLCTNLRPPDQIYINITGGTKLMSASATVAAYMVKAVAYYIKSTDPASEEDEPVSERIIELPLPRVSPNEVKGLKQNVLSFLETRGTIKGLTSIIRDELEISAQRASYHINELQSAGLIQLKSEGKHKIARITAEGRIVLALLKND